MEKKKFLFIDSTMRPEAESRTARLCQAYLNKFEETYSDYEIIHRQLAAEDMMPNKMEDVIAREEDDSLLADAKEFALADHILIGAPYWDLFFPALLKVYLEKVCIAGVTFRYTEDGVQPLCKAKKMTYLMTCGGYLKDYDFGADYLKGLCDQLFGIPVFEFFHVDALDIEGMDVEAIMKEAIEKVEDLV